jgi:hypothetical protein
MLGFQAAYARRGIKPKRGEWLALGYQFRISLRPRSWHCATRALGHGPPSQSIEANGR